MNFEKLSKLYELTITEEGKVIIEPDEDGGFTTYPLTENGRKIEISQDDFVGLLLGIKRLDETKSFVVDI